jgi:hypothetical protein
VREGYPEDDLADSDRIVLPDVDARELMAEDSDAALDG